MRHPDSQTTLIREYLETGKRITPLEALDKFNCFRLAARIDDMRGDGIQIRTEMVEDRGKRYARYFI